MLVDIMTPIIGPFDFCTGNPMQVEQMTAIVGRIRFIRRQAKSGLTIIKYMHATFSHKLKTHLFKLAYPT